MLRQNFPYGRTITNSVVTPFFACNDNIREYTFQLLPLFRRFFDFSVPIQHGQDTITSI